jgi:hypothetical protein
MLNQIFALTMFVLLTAFVFSKQIAAVLNHALQANERSTGVRVFNRRTFRDVNTAESFDVWRGVTGFRLTLISLILKI